MFLKKFIVANCQSLIREVFTTSRVYGKPDVGIRATTNRAPLQSSCCFDLMSTFLNKTGTQPSHCILTHSGHKYKPNEPSDGARWPLSQMTCCGHKRNEPSICTWWRFSKLKRRMNSTVVLLNNTLIVHGLISADCSSQDHDDALTIRNCEKNEKQINDYYVTISEKVEAGKKTIKRLRKRDMEPSRIPVKRILKGLNKRKFRKKIQYVILPKSLCSS